MTGLTMVKHSVEKKIQYFDMRVDTGTVCPKSHDPCFRKKYMEAEVVTFAVHCTWE